MKIQQVVHSLDLPSSAFFIMENKIDIYIGSFFVLELERAKAAKAI
jgi:hypothetical protein